MITVEPIQFIFLIISETSGTIIVFLSSPTINVFFHSSDTTDPALLPTHLSFEPDPDNPNKMWVLEPPTVPGPDGKPKPTFLDHWGLMCPHAGFIGYMCNVRRVVHVISVGDVHKEKAGEPVTFVPQTMFPVDAGKCMSVIAPNNCFNVSFGIIFKAN